MKKTIAPTLYNYLITNKATGEAETIKEVKRTFYHDGIVELLLIDETFLEYETSAVTVTKL